MEFKDYYKILEVNSSADEQAIKKSYKSLAKKYHPDSSTGSEEKFKEIQEAYEVLKNSDKRSKYDAMYRNRGVYSSQHSADAQYKRATNNQAYKQKMYSGFGTKPDSPYTKDQSKTQSDSNKSSSSASSSSSSSSSTSNKDTYKGQSTSNTSSNTSGSSFKETLKDQVKQAANDNTEENSGAFSDFFKKFFGADDEDKSQKSSGKPSKGDDFELDMELDLEDCVSGTSRKLEISNGGRNVRRIEVSIPPGVKDGNKIKITGEGRAGRNGGENGDLLLKIKVKEHSLFRLEEDDVHADLLLEPYEAILGAEKEVLTLDSKVEIVIPPGTKAGKVLRLRAKGLMNNKTARRGDHYLHVQINIHDEYSSEELRLYRQIRRLHE